MSKYEPLRSYLEGCREPEVAFTFDDIERLGVHLPPSARAHSPWWANETGGGHVQARSWMDAGWRTSRVDVSGEKLVFVRDRRAEPSPAKVSFKLESLSLAARKLLTDYTAEGGGDIAGAVARALHEAAVARRKRAVEEIVGGAPRMPQGEPRAEELIRADRHAH